MTLPEWQEALEAIDQELATTVRFFGPELAALVEVVAGTDAARIDRLLRGEHRPRVPLAASPASDPRAKLGNAVENGVLRYVSASQVSTAAPDQDGGCLRKWWFTKVQRIKVPDTPSQALGRRVHAEIEHYLKTGEDVLGEIVRPGRHLLPLPGAGLRLEHGIGIGPDGPVPELVAAGVPFVGYVDCVNKSGTWVTPEGEHVVSLLDEVIDWKTSGDPAKYAKAGSALGRTVQMVSYGRWALETRPDRERVRVSHVTFATKGRKHAVKTTAVLDRLTIAGRWLTVARTVETMKDAARETDPAKVDPNYNSCGAYGGCPFRAICPRDAKTALRDLLGAKSEKLMSLLDDDTNDDAKPFSGAVPGRDPRPAGLTGREKISWLKAEQEAQIAEAEAEAEAEESEAKAQTKAAPPPVKAPPAPPPPPAPKGLTSAAAKPGLTYLVTFLGELTPGKFCGKTKGGFEYLLKTGAICLTETDVIYPTGVLAADVPAAGVSGPIATAIPAEDVVPENVRRAAEKIAPPPPPVEAAPVEKKTRKPRAKKLDVGPAVEEPVDPGPAPEEHTDPDDVVSLTPRGETVVSEREAELELEPEGFTLLVDCAVTALTKRANCTSAIGLIDEVHQALRVAFKCADARCASDEKLRFGQWRGVFAAALRAEVEARPLTGYVVLETKGSDFGALAFEVLAPLALTVIRGL